MTHLGENECLLSALVEHAPTGMYVVDDQFRMQQINARARPSFATVQPLLGRDFSEVVRILWGPALGAQIEGIFRHTLATGERYLSPPFSAHRHDIDTNQSYDWETQRVTLPDGRHRVVCYFTDITERMRAESELIETIAEAKKANLAKSDFLSNMSHELRSPLNAILGFAQLIESGSPPPTPSQKAGIDQILQAGWYLLELISEILDLAMIESGKLSLSPELISLNQVMRDCLAMIEPQAKNSGISLTFPRFDSPYFVKADRTRVKQILINLLSNAIKYNKAGGAVTVECIAITPERIRISVKDTGDGLSAEKIAQLFQPFNRLGQETGTKEGTGIGLVMSKRLIELMAGTIGVESTVGRGSVFWIELNLTAAPQFVADADYPITVATAQIPTGAPLRTVLYVEDNPANLLLMETLLERRPDIRLLSALDGNRGIEMARASLPDMILMDINLPGISGIEALRILAKDPATAHIPVVALSANAMPRDIVRGLEAGFFRYLTKPIKFKELLDTLDAALQFAETQSARANMEE